MQVSHCLTHLQLMQIIGTPQNDLKNSHKDMIDMVWYGQTLFIFFYHNTKIFIYKVIKLPQKGSTGVCVCFSLILTLSIGKTKRAREREITTLKTSTRVWLQSYIFDLQLCIQTLRHVTLSPLSAVTLLALSPSVMIL